MNLRIAGPHFPAPASARVVNTTSHSTDLGRGLSPFLLGPVDLYGGYQAKLFECAWQGTKVYEQHTFNSEPTEAYWAWAKSLWASPRPIRYPFGKPARKPLYSLWDGRKLSYIEARKTIYIPLYRRLVAGSPAFERLKEMAATGEELWLWDFDGYDYTALGMTLTEDVVNCETRKMGHAFVLAMMLEGKL